MGYIVSCTYCDEESEIEAWDIVREYRKVSHIKCPNCLVINGVFKGFDGGPSVYRIGSFTNLEGEMK